jgi:hypothetical protein
MCPYLLRSPLSKKVIQCPLVLAAQIAPGTPFVEDFTPVLYFPPGKASLGYFQASTILFKAFPFLLGHHVVIALRADRPFDRPAGPGTA